MTLNMLNVAKICRICLAEGARNIFDRTNCSTTQGGVECIASLENLLEKMRYVTMVQIKENDTLPKMICDSCIVQLNVSYNFKRKAMENDLKLRQYIIEKGLDTTIDKNTGNVPTLYYTSNISIMHNNSENVERNFNPTNADEINATIINTEQTGITVVSEKYVPEKQIIRTIPHPIPIKLELIDSPIENDCNSRFIPELSLPKPNLMVVVNDNNTLLTQSIPSSNSTSTIPSSGSSSFTNENNLRDSEFLRNYVQNKINFDASITKTDAQVKIDRRYKSVRKMLHSKREKFLKKHIKKNLSNVNEPNATLPKKNFKVTVDLRNLILDQKENFSSALKMRNHNTKLFYSLRHNQKKPGRPKKEIKRLEKVKDVLK